MACRKSTSFATGERTLRRMAAFEFPQPHLICAHRCLWQGDEQPNTLAALQVALAGGAEMVEFDVRRSLDGVLYAWHDSRLPDGSRSGQMRFAEITARLGRAPALVEELLEEAAGLTTFNIDLKERGLERSLLQLVGQLLPARDFLLSTLDRGQLQLLKRLDQTISVGLSLGRPLTHPATLRPLRLATRHRPDLLLPDWRHLRLGVAARAFRRGCRSLAWTVDEPGRLQRLLSDPQLAGVITNRPALAHALRSAS